MNLKQGLAMVLTGAMVSPAAELNVRNVVLYKHGVGYFERSGELSAGESARLDFKSNEMNDVLKSLTVEVKGGSGVAGLRYDSSEPLSKKLQQLPVKLDPQQPMSALIDQMRGAQLELKAGGQTMTGTIVSARLVPGTREQQEREQVTLLLDSGELRSFELALGSSIRFPDPKLQLLLKDYLTAMTQARSTDKRSVYVDSTDSGRRTVSASYMIPTPVWKSSYRLILTGAEPTLEGWAIVDNTTGEDWTNVQLALVSGRPISFISKLYEPRYIQRPEADLADERAAAPVVHAGNVLMAAPLGGAAAQAPRRIQQQFRQEKAMAADAPAMVAALPAAAEAVASTVEGTAEGRELGDLFEYRFGKPVTVKRNESAMLPFLQQKIGARKLLIYTDTASAHPMNAAELVNSTGKTLDGGPITVYDAGAYAGEALFETTKTGDKRLISYGIDIGTRITTAIDSGVQSVREVHLKRGVLSARSAVAETKTFTIRNVDAKAKTLIIEHPIREGYKLTGAAKPSATSTKHYRFEVALKPDSTDKFVLQEERMDEETYMVSSLNAEFLASHIQNRSLSAEGRRQLETIAGHKRQMAQVDRDLQRADAQSAEIFKDQERIRQNLESLNRVAGQQEQVNRYAKQLSDQEAQLAQLRDRSTELRRRKATLESELSAMLEKLEF